MSDIVARARKMLDGITEHGRGWETRDSDPPEPPTVVHSGEVEFSLSVCCDCGTEAMYHNPADAAFIAAAPQIVADLADEVERMRQQPVELNADNLRHAVEAEAERDEALAEVERLRAWRDEARADADRITEQYDLAKASLQEARAMLGHDMAEVSAEMERVRERTRQQWEEARAERAERVAERDEALAAVERVRALADEWEDGMPDAWPACVAELRRTLDGGDS